MKDLTVVTEGASKGRSFRATLVAYVSAKTLWDGASHDNLRPAWATIACRDAESLPFIRNLQSGRKAAVRGERSDANTNLEFLKSSGYEYHAQRHCIGYTPPPDERPIVGVVWTVFLPDLYRIDPGMQDPSGVRFLVLPSPDWVIQPDNPTAKWIAAKYRQRCDWNKDRQKELDANMLDVGRYISSVAPLFCAYLDRRTRCPLIPDPQFYAMVLAAMLNANMVSLNSKSRDDWGHNVIPYTEYGLADVGLYPGLVCHVSHERLEPLLAEVVKDYESTRRSVCDMKQAA